MMNRYDPFREMFSLRDAMDRLFQESFVAPSSLGGGGGAPMDVEETGDSYEMRVSLPGWRPEDINITVQQNTVSISGQHRSGQQADENKTWHVRERRMSSFNRSFSFPTPIDSEKVEARFENGELMLTLPKAESAKPRQIKIGGGHQAQSAMSGPSAQAPASGNQMPSAQQPTKEPSASGANR